MKRFFALLLCGALLLAVLAGCKKTPQPEPTTPEDTPRVSVETGSAPQTKAEIIAFFNDAVDRVKVEKPGYKWKVTKSLGDFYSDTGNQDTLVQGVLLFLNQNPHEQDPVKAGESHIDFPVSRQEWASRLALQTVGRAECVSGGRYYHIELRMMEEKHEDIPKEPVLTRHGKVFNIYSDEEVMKEIRVINSIMGAKSIRASYAGCYITCMIDKYTGALQSITYVMNMNLQADTKDGAAGITFTVTEEYTLG